MASWGKAILETLLAVIINTYYLIFNLVKYLLPGPFEKVNNLHWRSLCTCSLSSFYQLVHVFFWNQ